MHMSLLNSQYNPGFSCKQKQFEKVNLKKGKDTETLLKTEIQLGNIHCKALNTKYTHSTCPLCLCMIVCNGMTFTITEDCGQYLKCTIIRCSHFIQQIVVSDPVLCQYFFSAQFSQQKEGGDTRESPFIDQTSWLPFFCMLPYLQRGSAGA